MFTGLIETLGSVACSETDGMGGRNLTITAKPITTELRLGESVAVNGVCLTVIAADSAHAQFQVGPETLDRTNLGQLKLDDPVNLERSLAVGARLGGHFVLGHVDGVGQLTHREIQGEWELLQFRCSSHLTKQMVKKGSIAVDGISLTLVDVVSDGFSVMLIPHTRRHTTLGPKQVGDPVNLETDILAKHVEKMLGALAKG